MSTTGESSMDNLMNKMLGTGLTSAEKEANAYSSSESEKSRLFTSAEADRDRAWQEEQMEKYNSLSGKIAQARESGVNPLYAVTGNAVSPASASGHSPATSSASSVTPLSGNIGGLISSMLSAFKTKAEVDLMRSEADKNVADTEGQKIYNDWADALHGADYDNKVASTCKLFTSSSLDEATLTKVDKEIELIGQQIVTEISKSELNYATIRKFNSEISAIEQGIKESIAREGLASAQTREVFEKITLLKEEVSILTDDVVRYWRRNAQIDSYQKEEHLKEDARALSKLHDAQKEYQQLLSDLAEVEKSWQVYLNDDGLNAIPSNIIRALNSVAQMFGKIFGARFHAGN